MLSKILFTNNICQCPISNSKAKPRITRKIQDTKKPESSKFNQKMMEDWLWRYFEIVLIQNKFHFTSMMYQKNFLHLSIIPTANIEKILATLLSLLHNVSSFVSLNERIIFVGESVIIQGIVSHAGINISKNVSIIYVVQMSTFFKILIQMVLQ